MFIGKKKKKEQETSADLAKRAEKEAEKADILSKFAIGISIFMIINKIVSLLIENLGL